MATYEYAQINESPVVSFKAASSLTAPKALALALGASGVALPSAGAACVGIALISNPDSVASGGDVDVQVKDIALWEASAAITAGALLATTAAGKAVTASTVGHYIIARALEAATAAGDLIKVQILNAGATVPAS